METFFTILLILVCLLLVLVVLMQNSKGGGISSEFSTANQIIGVTRGADFIEKTTWTLAGIMLVLSLLLSPKMGNNGTVNTDNTESATRKKAAGAVMPASTPAAPMQNNTSQPNQPK